MRATTLLLPDPLRRGLRAAAARRGISLGELVRRELSRVAAESGRVDEATGAVGRRSRKRILPPSVDDYLGVPAGTFAGLGLPGRASAAEDPYAGVD